MELPEHCVSTVGARFPCWLLPVWVLLLMPSAAVADGGALRLSDEKDGYRIAVFTTPTPLRAGPADISVLVQDAATGELASGVQVVITARKQDGGHHVLMVDAEICQPATTEAATNKLYYAATFNLPEAGWYSVEISIVGAKGATNASFDVEAAGPLPPALTVLPWVAWPLVAIALFVIHQFLVRRKSGRISETTIQGDRYEQLPAAARENEDASRIHCRT